MTRPLRPLAAVLTTLMLGLATPTLIASPAGAHEIAPAPSAAIASASAPSAATAEAESLLELINDERAAAGLNVVASDPALADIALKWSTKMAKSNRLSHNPVLRDQVEVAALDRRSLGENVGVGADIDSLHQAFMASAGHRRNVLGDFDLAGIGVKAAQGRLWVTVDFVSTS